MTETLLSASETDVEIKVDKTDERKGREMLLAKKSLNDLVPTDPFFEEDGDTIIRGQE